MYKFLITEFAVTFLTTIKWSGLGTPPLEPRPSQYAWPLPSMTAPGLAVMVIPAPLMVIGLKLEEFVNPKVVRPSKVTVVPAWRPDRSIADPFGAAILDRTMLVQEAMAEEI